MHYYNNLCKLQTLKEQYSNLYIVKENNFMKSATNNGLKHARLNKKLSISELAIAINKDTSTIHLWEDGLKAIDSLILEQLSDILDCSTELLLFGEIRESLNINDLSYEQQKVVYDLAMMLKQYNKENENGLR